jgi:hypothetical protein
LTIQFRLALLHLFILFLLPLLLSLKLVTNKGPCTQSDSAAYGSSRTCVADCAADDAACGSPEARTDKGAFLPGG